MSNKEYHEKMIERYEKSIQEHRDAIKTHQSAILSILDAVQKYKDKLNLLKKESIEKEDDLIAFYLNIEENSGLYDEVCNFFKSLGLRICGRWSFSYQIALQFWISKFSSEDCLNKIQNSLLMVIPHIIPDENGIKYISIMEDTLSEFGSYKLQVYQDIYSLVFNGYGGKETLYESKDLMNVLKYIQKYHPYC